MGGLITLFILLSIPFFIVFFNFMHYIFKRKVFTKNATWKFVEIFTIVIYPIIFLSLFDLPNKNDCCADSAVFSPENRLGIYLLIFFYSICYVIATQRKQVFAPLAELFLNIILIIGFILNILILGHANVMDLGMFITIIGNTPIILLILIKLDINHKLIIESLQTSDNQFSNSFSNLFLKVLKSRPLIKFPLLLVLSSPILIFFSLILFVFGQKPDTLILAFTETYKHGFSQLDYMCDNVNCGGHFLCSVGALGHKHIVKPIRYGERNNEKIICNRQLLISNAFEDFLQEKSPKAHYLIRKKYNQIGNLIHKHYHIFNNPWVSDFVYLSMKPLEWMFLFVLYCIDAKPENRIALQYLKQKDKEKIKELYSPQTCSKTQI